MRASTSKYNPNTSDSALRLEVIWTKWFQIKKGNSNSAKPQLSGDFVASLRLKLILNKYVKVWDGKV
jgi:hypothetical protein